jgi:hypothetical protein
VRQFLRDCAEFIGFLALVLLGLSFVGWLLWKLSAAL